MGSVQRFGGLIASSKGDGVLDRPISQGIDLQEILDAVSKHYLTAALKHTNGNKTKAAELVGLGNYQTFTNWMKRCGLE